MITQYKRLIGITLIAVLLLLIPLIAMQFTKEVNWSLFDFVVAGVLLFGTGLACELVLRKVKTIRHRVILCAIFIAVLFIIWIELAIGIFGTPFGDQ